MLNIVTQLHTSPNHFPKNTDPHIDHHFHQFLYSFTHFRQGIVCVFDIKLLLKNYLNQSQSDATIERNPLA